MDKILMKYRQELEEIIIESEHVYRLTIDYEILDLKINELIVSANEQGVPEKTIWELVHARIPSYVNYKNYKSAGKKAA